MYWNQAVPFPSPLGVALDFALLGSREGGTLETPYQAALEACLGSGLQDKCWCLWVVGLPWRRRPEDRGQLPELLGLPWLQRTMQCASVPSFCLHPCLNSSVSAQHPFRFYHTASGLGPEPRPLLSLSYTAAMHRAVQGASEQR